MNVLCEMKKMFNVDTMNISERNTVVEISFNLSQATLPDKETFSAVFALIPIRDTMKITLIIDNGDVITVRKNSSFPDKEYSTLVEDVDDETKIDVHIEINKNIESNTFSVYSFEKFTADLLEHDIKEILSFFSHSLTGKEFLVFEILEGNYFFTTESMAFVSKRNSAFNGDFHRLNRLNLCNEASSFYNKSIYELIPDDFFIKVDFDKNPLTKLFETLCSVLSLAYLSSSAIITESNELNVQIWGQRKVEFTYSLVNPKINPEFYRIYRWIYTDGNPVDKSILARNIISLHCRYSALTDLDEKTLSSIQSNYQIYLKDNVSQYIELKNSDSSITPYRVLYVNVRPIAYFEKISVSPSVDPRDLDDMFLGTQIDYLIQNISDTSAVDIRVYLNGQLLHGPFSLIAGSEASIGIYFFDERGHMIGEYPRHQSFHISITYTNGIRNKRLQQDEDISIEHIFMSLREEPPFMPDYDARTGLSTQSIIQ